MSTSVHHSITAAREVLQVLILPLCCYNLPKFGLSLGISGVTTNNHDTTITCNDNVGIPYPSNITGTSQNQSITQKQSQLDSHGLNENSIATYSMLIEYLQLLIPLIC